MKKLDAVEALCLSNTVIYAKDHVLDEKWWNSFMRWLVKTEDVGMAMHKAKIESGI